MRFVRRSAFLRETVGIVGWMNLVFNGAFLALIVRARELGGSPGQIGLMLAAYGAGGILGALAAPAVHRRLPGPGACWSASPGCGRRSASRWRSRPR